jgi:hypothetical protein
MPPVVFPNHSDCRILETRMAISSPHCRDSYRRKNGLTPFGTDVSLANAYYAYAAWILRMSPLIKFNCLGSCQSDILKQAIAQLCQRITRPFGV